MGLLGLIKNWINLHAQQAELRELSDAQLKDIGLYRRYAGIRTGMHGS